MSRSYSSWQTPGRGGAGPKPSRDKFNLKHLVSSSSPSSRRLDFSQATPHQHTFPIFGSCGPSFSSAFDGGNPVGRSRGSTQGKNKKGMLAFMNGVLSYPPFPSKRPEISTPSEPVHLTHVISNPSTGELTGLPEGWEQLLPKKNHRYQENTREVVEEPLEFHQGAAGAPGKLAREIEATVSPILQRTNGDYGIEEEFQNPSMTRTRPEAPRGIIIDHAVNFILKYPQKPNLREEDIPKSAQTRALQEIDGEIILMENTLETLLAGLRTSLTGRVSRRKKERNTLVRLHQLPLEIASEILWLSIADPWAQEPSYSFLQRRWTISSVCSCWRTVVECSPRFWSIVELSSPPRHIATLLNKFKHGLLEVKCFSDMEYNPASRITRMENLRRVTSHTDRVRSLVLSAPSTGDILALLNKAAPMLEELKLRFETCGLFQPIDLFCGQASRLRDVELENIQVRWDSRVLQGLRSLKIKANPAYSPTETEVIRLLEANPGLEKLDIEDVRFTEGFGDSLGRTRFFRKPSRVTMAKMRRMRLVSLPFELVRVILGAVETPSIMQLDVMCLFRGHSASQLLGPTIKHLVPPIIRGSIGADLAELKFGDESVGLAIYLPYQADPAIQIQLNNTAPVSGCEWFSENIFAAEGLPDVGEPETFRVNLKFGDNFDMRAGAFIPILERLATVKVNGLTIENGCKCGEELIEYLGEMQEDFRWPLPHLTSLMVEGSARTATHLLVALQSRNRGVDMNGIAALEELNIEGLGLIDTNVEANLAEVIGPSGTLIRAARPRQWQSSWISISSVLTGPISLYTSGNYDSDSD